MNAAVVIPWGRAGGAAGDRRRLNLERVLEHLAPLHDDMFVHLAIDDGRPFTPGRARNRGAAAARDTLELLGGRLDVLVFNDADSLVPLAQLRAAAQLALLEPGLVFAYTDYLREDEVGELSSYVPASGSHGCIAISADCFAELGGYDERFAGWGYEDLEFNARAAARWPLARVAGELRHLWHPPSDERSEAERDVPCTREQLANHRLFLELTS